MKDRVRVPKQFDGLLEFLREQNVFETYEKAFVFAAALGYRLEPESVVGVTDVGSREIPLGVFERSDDDGFIDALAVAVRRDLEVLSPERMDERIEIVEHFASIGLGHIQNVCCKPGQDPLDGMVGLMERYGANRAPVAQLPGLEASARQIGDML